MYRKSIYTKERVTVLDTFYENKIYKVLWIYRTGTNQGKTGKSCAPSGVSGPSKFLSSPLPFPL